MDNLNLTLRQRKLLHLIQNKTQITTGAELARELNVSARTIRSDIVEINSVLAGYGAEIHSEKSKGYMFTARDSELIRKMNQIDTAFFTTEDRVHYLTFQLCLADEPVNLFDLEDEMFVSHTTLEHDLRTLRIKYELSSPHIGLFIEKNTVRFEPDERKKRQILNRLFHEDWNYNQSGNAYYDYHFLDTDVLDYIMDEVPKHLNRWHIRMEDAALVSLNLALAIMYHRCLSGHPLNEEAPIPKPDTAAMQASESIVDTLEKKLHCSFRRTERDSIYLQVSSGHLMDADKLNFQTIPQYFGPVTQVMGSQYLERIFQMFAIDFREDEDFYITLLQFIHYLQTPVHLFNTQGNISIAKESLQIEFELAWEFQPIALANMGRYLDEIELLHMAHCLSGALEYLYHNQPEKKLHTVICCHLHLSETWALKRKILGAFDNYITVTDLLPVNAKSAFDFSGTDLVLSTVKKEITFEKGTDTIQISPLMTSSDYRGIESYIRRKRIERCYTSPSVTWNSFLETACWHEGLEFDDQFALINFQAKSFVESGTVNESFVEDILRRESISSFAFHPGILLIYSHQPARETKGSVLILKHRISWNSFRIRAVVMVSFHPSDLPFLFQLKSRISFYNQNQDLSGSIRTKKDFMELFSDESAQTVSRLLKLS